MGRGETMEWRKSCDCKHATATTGQIRGRTEKHGDGCVFIATLIPGLSCDTCGKEWTLLHVDSMGRKDAG